MQFGHVGMALAIATVDPRPETFAVVFAAQFLPNADSLIIRAGLARPGFHGTYSHSVPFIVAVWLAATALFGPWLGALAGLSIATHVVADLPTIPGIPILLPFSDRRFSFRLWHDSGYWGREMYAGYYRQPWARRLELAVALLVIGLYAGRWAAFHWGIL
ncbi:MAG: metal-dependent hydrolase [Gemmatimonadetes bacterium]|nr:metal-dependent hydrolase [Gemmatimonadota bacterium]